MWGLRRWLRVLFAYCSFWEAVLVSVGSLAATAAGIGYLAFDYLMWSTIGSTMGVTRSSVSHTLVEMGYFLAAIAIALLFFSAFSDWLLRVAASRRCDRIRKLLVASLLQRDMCWFEREPEAVHEAFLFLRDSVEVIEEGIGSGYQQFIFCVSICIGGFIVSFVFSTQLSLVLLGTMPLIVAGMAVVSRFTVLASDLDEKAFGSAARRAMKTLRDIKTVISNQQEDTELSKFERLLLRSKAVIVRTVIFMAIGQMAAQGVAVIDMGIGLSFMATVTDNHTADRDIDGSTLVWVLTTMIYGGLSLGYSTEGLTAMAKAVDLIERMRKTYLGKGADCFDRLDLRSSWVDGEKVAIVTLAPINQKAAIAVQVIGQARSGGVVGFVGNEPGIVNGTVRDNLLLGFPSERAIPSDDCMIDRLNQVGLCKFLDCLSNKLDTVIKRGEYPPMTLAQERQLSLARALLRSPSMLVLDRVSEGLVPEDERIIELAVRSVVRQCSNLTIVSVPNTFRGIEIFDRICVFDQNGHCLESGHHSDLVKDEEGIYVSLLKQNDPNLLVTPPLSSTEETIPALMPHMSDDRLTTMSRASIRRETAIVHRPLRLVETKKLSWSRILGLSRKYWYLALPVGVVGSCCVGAIPPIVIFILANLTEAFDTPPVLDSCQTYINLLFGLGGLMAGASLVKEVAYGRIREGTVHEIRLMSMKHILNQPVDMYEAGNTPESVMSSLWRRCYSTGTIACVVISSTTECISWFLVAVIISFVASSKVAVLSVSSMVALLIAYYVFYRFLPNPGESGPFEASSSLVADAISSIRTIKSIKAEHHVLDLFIETLSDEQSRMIPNNFILSLFAVLPFCVGPLLTSFGFWYAGVIYEATDSLTVPKILQTTYGVGDAGELAMYVISWLPDFVRFERDAIKVFDLLDNDFSFDKGDEVVPSIIENISFRRVSFAYSYSLRNQVLCQLSIELKRGQLIGLVGPFKSGKTSILNLIQRMYDPQYGKIILNHDMCIRDFTMESYRRVQAVVPQQPVVFQGSSYRENVFYGSEFDNEIAKLCNFQWDDALVDAGASCDTQKISIARALARKPQILLLDEPFNRLDAVSGHQFRTFIENSREGRISVIATANCDLVRSADRIYVIDKGNLVQTGTYDDLVDDSNGIFYKMTS